MFSKIKSFEWQFIIPVFICLLIYILTDLIGIIDKIDLAYWSGGMLIEPYRLVTAHFTHHDIHHLLANIGGMIIARYCLIQIGLRNNYFSFIFIPISISFQVIMIWFVDIFLLNKVNSFAIGMSGLIYSLNSFILLSSVYGKSKFLTMKINLKQNKIINKIMKLLVFIGFLYSFFPGISLKAHLAGFIIGSLLFLI
tara:strand:+ start:329 stop:916 length:588 start_codon:yes stop_codon:yes gene_type:complete